MTDQELKDLVDGLAIAQDRIDKKIEKLSESQAKTDARIAETNKQLAKTSKKVDNPADMFGGVSKNQGRVAEDFFFTIRRRATRSGRRGNPIGSSDSDPSRGGGVIEVRSHRHRGIGRRSHRGNSCRKMRELLPLMHCINLLTDSSGGIETSI